MLLSARGNSGVILSQIFEGMARALDGAETADAGAYHPCDAKRHKNRIRRSNAADGGHDAHRYALRDRLCSRKSPEFARRAAARLYLRG